MPEIKEIINKMLDAGESEENIGIMINHYSKLNSNSKVEPKTEIEPPEKELYITSDFISRDEEEITAYEEQELDKIKSVNSGQNVAFIGSGSSSITPTPKPRKRYIESEIIDLANKAQEIQDPNNLTDEEIERIKKNINSEKINKFEKLENINSDEFGYKKIIKFPKDIDPEEYQSWLDGETNFITDSNFEEAKEVFVNGRIKTFYNNMDDDKGRAVQKFIEYTKDEITEEVANVEEAEEVLNETMGVNGWTQTEDKDGKKSHWTHPDIEEINKQNNELEKLNNVINEIEKIDPSKLTQENVNDYQKSVELYNSIQKNISTKQKNLNKNSELAYNEFKGVYAKYKKKWDKYGSIQDPNLLDNFSRDWSAWGKLEQTTKEIFGNQLPLAIVETLDWLGAHSGGVDTLNDVWYNNYMNRSKGARTPLTSAREYLLDVGEDFMTYRNTKLGKPYTLEEMKSGSGDWGNFIANTTMETLPYSVLAATGPYTSAFLIGSSGFGSKMNEIGLEERDARESLPGWKKRYKAIIDGGEALPGELESLESKINQAEKVLNTDQDLKFMAGMGHGIAESLWSVGFGKIAQVKAWRNIHKKVRSGELSTGKAFKTIGTQFAVGGPSEAISEAGTELQQNLTDILLLDSDINPFENVEMAGAKGYISSLTLGGAGAGVNTIGVFNNMASLSSDRKQLKEYATELESTLKEYNELDGRTKESRELKGKVLELKKKISTKVQLSLSNLSKLNSEQLYELGELYRQQKVINDAYVSSVLGDSEKLTENERKDLEDKFNKINDKKRKILENPLGDTESDINFKDQNEIKYTDALEVVMEKGDLDVYNQNMESLASVGKTLGINIIIGKNEEDTVNKINEDKTLTKDEKGRLVEEFKDPNSTGQYVRGKTIIINNEAAFNQMVFGKSSTAAAVAPHEVLHHLILESFDDKDIVKLGELMLADAESKLGKSDPDNYYQNIVDRYKSYVDNKVGNSKTRLMEILNFYSDEMRPNKFKLTPSNVGFVNSIKESLNKFIKKIPGLKEFEVDHGSLFELKDVNSTLRFLSDFNTSFQKGDISEFASRWKLKEKAAKKKGQKPKGGRSQIFSSKAPLYKAIQDLVPKNIKTETDYQNFLKGKDFPKLYNSITQQDGAINNYIKGITNPEEFELMVENVADRVLGFNPEAVRKDGGIVGIEAFVERIMSDTRFSKLDAKKELAIRNKKIKQEVSIDDTNIKTQLADETSIDPDTKLDPTPVQRSSFIRRKLDIKEGDDAYNVFKKIAKKIFNEDIDPGLKSTQVRKDINKAVKNEKELKKAIENIISKEKSIDEQFLNNPDFLSVLRNLSLQDLAKLQKGAKKDIFVRKIKKLKKKAEVEKAIAENKIPQGTGITTGPILFERLPIDLKQVKEFFIGEDKNQGSKRKVGLVNVLIENLIKEAAPEVTGGLVKEGKMTPAERAKLLDDINQDPDIFFSKSNIEKAEELGDIIAGGELLDYFDPDTKKLINPELSKKYDSKIQKIIFELFDELSLLDKSSKGFKQNIFNSKKIPKKLINKFLKEGAFVNSPRMKKLLAKAASDIAKILGKDKMDVMGLDFLGFFNRGLDPASRKETKESVAARKKVREENEIRKKKGKKLLETPKVVYEKNVVGEFYNEYRKLKIALEKLPSSIETKKALESIRLMNKKFSLFKEIDKIRKLKTLAEKLETLEKLAPEIEAANKANIQLATDISTTINELYRKGKIDGLSVLNIYQLQTSAVGGLRALTSLDYITLEEGPQNELTKGEHLAPNANTMSRLAELTLDPNLSLKQSNLLIASTYKDHSQWYTDDALTKVVDDKGKKTNISNEKRILFLPTSDQSNVYHISGIKYRNKLVIDNILGTQKTKISKINNKILPKKDQLKGEFTNDQVVNKIKEVDNKNKEETMMFSSKSFDLNKDFNDIIESKTGIASEKVYAKVKAQVAGAGKGRFKFFVPPSAEDFVGLLYTTLAKNKLGDSQMAWYKTHLLDPYARAMKNINSDRLSMLNDYKALKKKLKIVPKNLRKKIPGEPFTKEQAIRVYIWNLQGMEIPGLSKADLKELTNFVEKDIELEIFAGQLIAINKGDGYAAPKEYWTSGNIASDLLEGLNTTKRAKYLELWQQNVDQIFSEANLNKLEAAYGKGYREALEGTLQRMKTGRNRVNFGGADSITSRFTDWLTNSIGAVMFFNTRSAILQTISLTNYINFKDNNPLAAAKALLNIKQYSKDFIYLMNSDLLKARRDGLKMNVSEADIADMAKDPSNFARRFIAWTLKKGFIPTQYADSFAIASGGATFYRNRVNKYIKEGMDQKAAEKQGFLDFQELTETSQQSSRPDKISQQQAGPLGRIILGWANTPMQYTREIKKAALDLKNGRGDVTTNISKILYYGMLQNLVFNAMQQALFAIAFEEDEEEEKTNNRYFNIANSMSDQFLRGSGVYGAVVSTIKNSLIKLNKEMDKKSPKYNELLVTELAQVSPPLGSKIRKLTDGGKSFSWNKKEMQEKGWALDNPAYLASANIISAVTNIPADRAIKKISNLSHAMNTDLQTWQRLASLGGWSEWQLGINKKKKSSKNIISKKIKSKKITSKKIELEKIN